MPSLIHLVNILAMCADRNCWCLPWLPSNRTLIFNIMCLVSLDYLNQSSRIKTLIFISYKYFQSTKFSYSSKILLNIYFWQSLSRPWLSSLYHSHYTTFSSYLINQQNSQNCFPCLHTLTELNSINMYLLIRLTHLFKLQTSDMILSMLCK